MNAFERRIALRVFGIHVGVIVFFVLVAGLKGCFQTKPKPEIVTFIEFGQAAPPVAVEQVAQMTEPEPPAPAPEPEPEPAKVPEPVKKPLPKPKPKPKEAPKPKPKPKPEPEKPKWKPTPADQIKVSKKKIEPEKPAIDPSEIDLSKVQSKSSTKPSVSGPVGNPNADAAYISQIGSYFDRRWTKPDSSAPAASAVVRIYISKWGTITQRTKIQGSGDAAFDASVMRAVNSVSTVPKPPSGFSYDYVEVEFRIRN